MCIEFNTWVSQFELNYWNKWTFPKHFNLLRCSCIHCRKFKYFEFRWLSMERWNKTEEKHHLLEPGNYTVVMKEMIAGKLSNVLSSAVVFFTDRTLQTSTWTTKTHTSETGGTSRIKHGITMMMESWNWLCVCVCVCVYIYHTFYLVAQKYYFAHKKRDISTETLLKAGLKFAQEGVN